MLFVILQSGFTPFLLAVSENKLKMAKFLSMKNANVHATDNQKRYYNPLNLSGSVQG